MMNEAIEAGISLEMDEGENKGVRKGFGNKP